jgi:hypothetical protein
MYWHKDLARLACEEGEEEEVGFCSACLVGEFSLEVKLIHGENLDLKEVRWKYMLTDLT